METTNEDFTGSEQVQVPSVSEFERWHGLAFANFDVTFLGQRTDFFFNFRWADSERTRNREAFPPYPALSEETFEWVALMHRALICVEN